MLQDQYVILGTLGFVLLVCGFALGSIFVHRYDGVVLRGPKGDMGPPGPMGPAGINGERGPMGVCMCHRDADHPTSWTGPQPQDNELYPIGHPKLVDNIPTHAPDDADTNEPLPDPARVYPVKDGDFGYSTPDTNGYVPEKGLIGQIVQHTGNRKTYEITGFAWMGDGDVWGFVHKRVDGSPPELCRPITHLTGNRSDGTRRYVAADL